jgi:hypothetical protein
LVFTVIAIIALTLVLLPLQLVGIAFGLPLQRWIPRLMPHFIGILSAGAVDVTVSWATPSLTTSARIANRSPATPNRPCGGWRRRDAGSGIRRVGAEPLSEAA